MRRLLAISLAAALVSACGSDKATAPDIATATFASSLNVQLATMTKTASGLYYRDSIVGTGASAQPGRQMTVHYTGWLADGTKFDSSVDRGTPFPFALGIGAVIAGWDEGVATMKVGGVRKLVVPPSLGYGDKPNGDIPANSILVFNVQLLGVK